MYALLFLTCLLSGDVRQDIPIIYIDNGYIEINHFWTDKEEEVNGKILHLGNCVFDQILIWKYNELTNSYFVFHWEMIPNGRERNRLIEPEEKNKHSAEINRRRINHLKWTAKRIGSSVEDLVIYIDSPWMGERTGFRRPEFNHLLQRWEIWFIINQNNHKFVVPTLVETNTLFDPEVDFKQRTESPNGSTKFLGFPHIKKKDITND